MPRSRKTKMGWEWGAITGSPSRRLWRASLDGGCRQRHPWAAWGHRWPSGPLPHENALSSEGLANTNVTKRSDVEIWVKGFRTSLYVPLQT